MIRLWSFLLSTVMLLQGLHWSLPDLAQLDDLLEHARYHKETFGDNFLTFVSKHYGDQKADHSQKHQEEQEQHDQLPFQHALHAGACPVFLMKNPGFVLTPQEDPDTESLRNFYYLLTGSAGYQTGIFQPPRQA
ncbi:hypothetical protein OZ410_02985 [Robiginitalea sp. M366]|uniref:hypothetical protein n=1 Tax=Robiginitalea aestuariiviva TaxID=3036903 RepID=UPI00240DE15F|nr:hypothetical protein [Robiginitalea aestuariiviva]MDG1571263.1 hypothetical protein [Robiginitalea aestuariiviva]